MEHMELWNLWNPWKSGGQLLNQDAEVMRSECPSGFHGMLGARQ